MTVILHRDDIDIPVEIERTEAGVNPMAAMEDGRTIVLTLEEIEYYEAND